MPFTNKVTLGTYISDGVRTGPVLPAEMYNSTYTTQGPNAVNPTGNIKARNYGEFGNSILLSSQNTYSIVPFNGVTPQPNANIFNTITGAFSAGIIPLFAGTANNTPCSVLVNSPTTGQDYIQFDYPRVPGVIVTYTGVTDPAPSLNNVRIVFRGTDGYGFPIEHQYTLTDTLGNAGIMYPLTYSSPVNNELEANSGTWACNVKAFDTITEVELLDNLPANYTLLGVVTNMFGLPYKCKTPNDIINMSWAGVNLKDLNGTITMAAVTGATADESPFLGNIVNPGVGQYYLDATADPTTYNITNGFSLVPGNIDGGIPDTPLGYASIFLRDHEGTPSAPSTYFADGFLQSTDDAYIPFMNLPVMTWFNADIDINYPVYWTIINGGYNLIQYADDSEPSLTSGDVRGIIRLPCSQDYYSTWSSPLYPQPDGFQYRLEFTQYVYGADNYQNQLSASGYLIGTEPNPTTAETTVIPLLTLQDLYGKTPFSGE